MKIQYVKRFQMAAPLTESILDPQLPDGFVWLPWSFRQTDIHGRVIYQSFVDDLDGMIFPTFRRLDSCLRLMRSVSSMAAFLPKGTWLIARPDANCLERYDFCGTIQGIRADPGVAAIQNVAVRPEYRRRGFGRALLLKAMRGFYASGCRRVTLNVTAENAPAIRLYQSVGMTIERAFFRETFISDDD